MAFRKRRTFTGRRTSRRSYARRRTGTRKQRIPGSPLKVGYRL